MNVVSWLRRLRPQIGDAVFLLVVAATYLGLFVSPTPRFTLPEVSVLFALGGVYAFVGTAGFARFQSAGSLPAALAYFAIQVGVYAAIVLVGRAPGDVGILMLPLAAQGTAVLPWRWALVVCAVVVALFAVPLGLAAGWPSAVQASIGYLAGVVFVVGFTYLALREERARAEVERLAADLREANEKLRAYAVQAEEMATTQERNRLAREIHDGLGHYLTALNMQLQAARAVWDSNPGRAADALGKAQTLTREALADVRRSVAALRASPTEDRPLPEALAPLVDQLRAAGMPTELVLNGTARDLSPQAGLALYRAAQEGLTNVHKHARASRVDLVLDYTDVSSVRLIVRDDGVGAQHLNGGFGLIGLRERVQYLGGELRTHSAEGQGFTLDVRVPG